MYCIPHVAVINNNKQMMYWGKSFGQNWVKLLTRYLNIFVKQILLNVKFSTKTSFKDVFNSNDTLN